MKTQIESDVRSLWSLQTDISAGPPARKTPGAKPRAEESVMESSAAETSSAFSSAVEATSFSSRPSSADPETSIAAK